MKAALYLRVSTDAQAERYSLPVQRRLLTEHCKRQGWTYEIYEDAGLSGETIDARPAMQRLLQDALDRKFDVVLAVEMERFSRSRDAVDLALIKGVFRRADVKFGTPAQLFDPADIEDDFVSGMLGLLASREKQKIVQRTSRGRYEAARSGRHVSRPPFGYRKVDGKLVVHEPEAQVVRLIYDLLARGDSSRAIVRALNARGIPSPQRKGKWARPTLFGILKNPAYGGTAYYGRRQTVERRGKYRKITKERDKAQWIAIRVPRIVPAEIVHQVQALLRRNALLSRRHQKRFYLLKGLVRCRVCGRAMVGKFSDKYRYYSCWRSPHMDTAPYCRWHAINSDKLESLVWQQVTLALRQPDLILAEARRYRESRLGERDVLLMRLDYVRNALQDIPGEQERLQLQHAEGYATLEQLARNLARIEQKRSKLDDERRGLEARLAAGAADEEQAGRLERVIARVARRLEVLTDAERFEVVHAFIDRVIVGPDQNVEIHAYVPTPSPKAKPAYVRTAWEEPVRGQAKG
jgi:site-specific DNA recombinase